MQVLLAYLKCKNIVLKDRYLSTHCKLDCKLILEIKLSFTLGFRYFCGSLSNKAWPQRWLKPNFLSMEIFQIKLRTCYLKSFPASCWSQISLRICGLLDTRLLTPKLWSELVHIQGDYLRHFWYITNWHSSLAVIVLILNKILGLLTSEAFFFEKYWK